jgi:hypothetical protein
MDHLIKSTTVSRIVYSFYFVLSLCRSCWSFPSFFFLFQFSAPSQLFTMPPAQHLPTQTATWPSLNISQKDLDLKQSEIQGLRETIALHLQNKAALEKKMVSFTIYILKETQAKLHRHPFFLFFFFFFSSSSLFLSFQHIQSQTVDILAAEKAETIAKLENQMRLNEQQQGLSEPSFLVLSRSLE